jgi:hypothetical protein
MKASSLFAIALTAFASANCNEHAKRDVHSHYLPHFYAQALRDAQNNPGPDGMPFIPVGAI